MAEHFKIPVPGEMERFFATASDLDQLFFFYSGHGLQQAFDRLGGRGYGSVTKACAVARQHQRA